MISKILTVGIALGKWLCDGGEAEVRRSSKRKMGYDRTETTLTATILTSCGADMSETSCFDPKLRI